jgi:HEAT repeat protein
MGALTEGALQVMLLTNLKKSAFLLVVLGTVAFGTGIVPVRASPSVEDNLANIEVRKSLDPKRLVGLAVQLRSKDHDERSAALAALAGLLVGTRDGDAYFGPVIEPLFGLAGWGGIARKNAYQAEALLVLIGTQTKPLLRQRLKSADAHDRRVAAELLVRIGPRDVSLVRQLRPLLTDPDGYVRQAAIHGLGIAGPPAKEAIDDLERVATNDPIVPRRVAARIALIQIAGASAERVGDLAAFLELKEPCEGAAVYAASALGDLGQQAQKAERQLRAALEHTEAGVRTTAAHALGQVGARSPATITALIGLLKKDPEREARRSAAWSLGQIGPAARAAIPALHTALQGDGRGGWYVAADALGKIGGAEVVPILTVALSNPDADIRLASMRGLGDLGLTARPAVPALEKARREDPREGNRRAAAEALRLIEQTVEKMKQDSPPE